MIDDAPVRVLFLAGIGRSGTTLIERTLGEVAGVTALGEVMHLWDRGLVRGELCACSRPFRECPFWTQVGDDAFGGWDNVDTERMAHLKAQVDRTLRVPHAAWGRPASFVREADEYVAHYVRVYRAAARLSGDVLVDSSKQASLAWLLQRSPDIDLRVLQCVRDSRGVTHSWSKVIARPEAISDEHAEMPRYAPPTMSAYWLCHNVAAAALHRRVPHLRLRYEDFVADPTRRIHDVLALAGISSELPHVRGSVVTLGGGHSCAGNPMRFRQGEIEVVPDNQWREQQPDGQRRLVTTLTAPLLLRYGYLR